eukprot:6272438-Alexandrium_andersonii.AAC.1
MPVAGFSRTSSAPASSCSSATLRPRARPIWRALVYKPKEEGSGGSPLVFSGPIADCFLWVSPFLLR